MKKILLLSLFILPILFTSASTYSFENKEPLVTELKMPLFSTGKFITVDEYLKLTPKTYRLITGKRMGIKERIEFGMSKRQLKKMINKDGTFKKEFSKKGIFGSYEWHWGGFALGLFLSFLGPIVALFFKDDYKWDRFWTALRTAVLFFLLLSAIVLAAA